MLTHPKKFSFGNQHLMSFKISKIIRKSFHATFCCKFNLIKILLKHKIFFRYYRFVEPPQPKLARSNQSTGQKDRATIPRNPIITVTEHTPTPSPDFMRRQVSEIN